MSCLFKANEKWHITRIFFCSLAILLFGISMSSHAADLPAQKKVFLGMYYFPGWSPNTGFYRAEPWKVIQAYPEREPLLGWYHDGKVETVSQQLEWMADYGIDFVAFAWYWERERPMPETAVRAYLNVPEPLRARVPYVLLWANHSKTPSSVEDWDRLVEYWLERHLKNPEYLRIDGKPAVFVFTGDRLREQSKLIGLTPAEMLERARAAARAKGLGGIYFVLCIAATDYWVKDFSVQAGFDATTGYNYHFGIAGDGRNRTPPSHSYAELDMGYRMQWKWILENTALPYFVPMTSGWDMRPWGGSKDPLHDNSGSTPHEFETHLRAGYSMITANMRKTKGIGMLCCWNEYGEGSIIEPTKHYGFEYLQRTQKVFSKGK